MTTLSVDEGVGHKHRTALCKVCAVGNTRRHAPGLLKVRNNLRLRRFDGTEVPVSHTSHLEDPGETASSRAAVAAPHVCSNRWWERQRGGERTPATCCVFAVWLYQPRRAPLHPGALTLLPSKAQRRTCLLRTWTLAPGCGIILQLHSVSTSETRLGLGLIWEGS